MKRVISNNELKLKMEEAIDLLCNTVKTTLGPKGSNVIIDHSMFSSFITNDGVTIAQQIESEDEVINTILTLAKEAAIKTNEIVGDGTTTTLVLLQSIFKNGLKYIDKGIKEIILKKEIDKSVSDIVNEIKKESRIPSKKELTNIACISSGDDIIGKNISDAYFKVKNKNGIIIKESCEEYTKVNYLKGYSFDTIISSPYFFQCEKEIRLEKPKILIINRYLNSIEDIADVINEMLEKNNNLLIIATDFNELVVNDILSINLDYKNKIILLKSPEYGINKDYILKDIMAISNAKIIETTNYITLNDLGWVNSVFIKEDKTRIMFDTNNNIRLRINKIKKDLKEYRDDKESFDKRICMLKEGIAEILVGAKTTSERRELKMRYDDALCAIDSASNGVVPGSGIVLYKISDKLVDNSIGNQILKQALTSPLHEILNNAGLDKNLIIKNIKENKFEVLYNISKDEFENVNNTKVLDPVNILVNSLECASSIAGLLLTTTSLIINEYQNNINKVNDYNEL